MQIVWVQVRKLEITLLLEGFDIHIGHVGLMEKQGITVYLVAIVTQLLWKQQKSWITLLHQGQ